MTGCSAKMQNGQVGPSVSPITQRCKKLDQGLARTIKSRRRQSVELIATWLFRVLVLPLALVLAWYAIRELAVLLGSTATEDVLSPTVAISGFLVVMAGWLMYAAVFPSPPWRNEPLKRFCICAGILVTVIALWIGTCLAAGEVVLRLFGKDHPLHRVLIFASLVVVGGLEYLMYRGVRSIVRKLKASIVETPMSEYEWHDNQMSLQHLRETEVKACADTIQQDAMGATTLTNLVNLFFHLSYHCTEPAVAGSPDHWFLSIANCTYIRLPYTLHCIQELWMRGNYLEAMILSRHLLEGLVALRYFHSRREIVKTHYMAKSTKGRVSFWRMFEECAPGLYDYLYRAISKMAHGGVEAHSFQTDRTSSTPGELLMGRMFDVDRSGYVYVIAGILSYGYLNYASVFFPSIDSNLDAIATTRKTEMLARLEGTLLSKTHDPFVQKISPLVRK